MLVSAFVGQPSIEEFGMISLVPIGDGTKSVVLELRVLKISIARRPPRSAPLALCRTRGVEVLTITCSKYLRRSCSGVAFEAEAPPAAGR